MPSDPQRFVRIGKIARAHGIRGEVAVRLEEPSSTTLLMQKAVWLKADGEPEPAEIETARAAHGGLLVRFVGCYDRTAAEKLAGREVWLPRACLPKPQDGEYYVADLVGLEARSPAGVALGKVVEVVDTGGVPVLEIEGDRRFQIPLVETFVQRIDLEAGLAVLEVPEEE